MEPELSCGSVFIEQYAPLEPVTTSLQVIVPPVEPPTLTEQLTEIPDAVVVEKVDDDPVGVVPDMLMLQPVPEELDDVVELELDVDVDDEPDEDGVKQVLSAVFSISQVTSEPVPPLTARSSHTCPAFPAPMFT